MKGIQQMILFASVIAIILAIVILAYSQTDWRLSKYEIHGIDVSRYQLDIDFEILKNQKYVDFVFVKASEGRSLKDKKFNRNWEALQKHKIPRGAYHFYRPSVKAKLQADFFIKNVKLQKGDLPPVLDLEATDNRSKAIILKGVKIWLETIEKHYKVKPIIYVNHDFYYQYIQSHFEEYPIWLAAYRWQYPEIAAGDWDFWQYTDEGRIEGIEGDVDKNVFYGNWNEFERFFVK